MDLLNTIEQVVNDVTRSLDSVKARRTLSQFLVPFMPHHWRMGLRVSHFSMTQMELVIPERKGNVDSDGQILEGVIVFAAGVSYRMYWHQFWPENEFHQIFIQQILFERFQKSLGGLRLRLEISEISRESAIAETTLQGKAQHECTFSVFDDLNQLVGKINIRGQITRRLELGRQ